MKMLTATRVAALAVGLSVVGAQAFAAPPDSRGRGHDNTASQPDQNDQGDRDHRKKKQAPPATGNQTPAVNPVVQPNPQNGGRGAVIPQNRNGRHLSDNRRGRNDQANDRWHNNNPNWRNNDRRRDYDNNDRRNWGYQDRRGYVDVTRYNRNFNAPRRFHVDRYRGHRGYSYRRYSYGQHLPNYYYGRNFWLSKIYGLFSPPPGYIWVRYGPDALLIDEETGEIVQVRYNMFYS